MGKTAYLSHCFEVLGLGVTEQVVKFETNHLRALTVFTNAHYWHYYQLCIPTYLQFSSLFATI